MTTFAPAAARCLAMALPMPRPPPVTRAVLPVREMEMDMAVRFWTLDFGFWSVALEFEFGNGFAVNFVGAVGQAEGAGGCPRGGKAKILADAGATVGLDGSV